jgi:hypothetical protein
MSTLITTGDIVRFALNGHAGDQAIVNVYDYVIQTYAGSGSVDDIVALQEWSDTFMATYATALAARQASDYTLDFCQTRVLDHVAVVGGRAVWVPIFNFVAPPSLAIIGTDGAADDFFAAATVRLQTSLAGRGNRGGKRIGPIAAANYANNVLGSTYRTNLAASVSTGNTNFIAAIALGTLAPATIRPVVAGASLNTGRTRPLLISALVSSYYVNSVVGSQVSRKSKERYA